MSDIWIGSGPEWSSFHPLAGEGVELLWENPLGVYDSLTLPSIPTGIFGQAYGLFFEFWSADLTQGDRNILCKYSEISPQFYIGFKANKLIVKFYDGAGTAVIDEVIEPEPYLHRWIRVTLWVVLNGFGPDYLVFVYATPAGETAAIPIATGAAATLPDTVSFTEPVLSGHNGRIRNIQLWDLS